MKDKQEPKVGTAPGGTPSAQKKSLDKALQEEKKKDEKLIEPEVKNELSRVAASPKKSIALLAGMVIVGGSMAYQMFFSGNDSSNKKPVKQEQVLLPSQIAKPTQDESNTPSVPKLPDVPKLESPTVAPPSAPQGAPLPGLTPPSPNKGQDKKGAQQATPGAAPVKDEKAQPQLPPIAAEPPADSTPKPAAPTKDIKSSIAKIGSDEDYAKRQEARMKSGIMLTGDTGGSSPDSKTKDDTKASDSKNKDSSSGSKTVAVQAKITKKGDLSYTLSKGKVIHASLANAIDSNIGGEVQAIISKDVYSEHNRNILIPKGSRVFGTYSIGFKEPYGRVNIQWNRIDLPTGYVVEFDAKNVDQLGREGMQGRVDMKNEEKLLNNVVVSAFNIAFAAGLDAVIPPVTTSSTSASNDVSGLITTAVTSAIASVGSRTPTAADINSLCDTNLRPNIKDKTSPAYTSVDSACKTAQSATGDITQTWSNLTKALLASANQTTAAAAQASQSTVQKASQDAYKQIGDTVKGVLTESSFTPRVTVDQGAKVEIYINADIEIPKEAVKSVRVIK